MDGPPLASLSLTHVNYDASDPISHLAAWLSLLPQALCVTYASLIWATREVEVGLMFAGQMACEALNFALKRYIKEERPRQMLGKGYGMPSSHAQFLAFFATYLGLFLLLRHRPGAHVVNRSSGKAFGTRSANSPMPLPSHQQQIYLVVVAVTVVAASVAASRVYLHYHTPKQVLAGAAAGIVAGASWFIITGILRASGIIDRILQMGLARQFRIRDLACQEDFVEAGWLAWERQREAKLAKKGR